ncbi:MAG: 2,3-bisphosphoglycerate-independent phosphoglycerate mutase [Patescibacteria group bacterium]
MTKKPASTGRRRLVLAVLDGWGHSPVFEGNAIANARTGHFARLWQDNPHTLLQASGEAVGLPWGEMGNSEVGHLNIGAGRVVPQDLPRVSAAIADGSFYENDALKAACGHARNASGTLHLIGLASSGGVHAHLRHLIALLDLARREKVKDVALHIFADGRDTPPKAILDSLKKLEGEIANTGVGKIRTICGRYYAMDRDNRWDRTRKAFEAIAQGKGPTASSVEAAISRAYKQGLTDEFIEPTVILRDGEKPQPLRSSDSAIFFNFRSDRIRQLAEAIAHAQFERFPRKDYVGPGYVSTLTQYEPNLPVHVAFFPQNVVDPLAKVLSDAGIRQFHIAETEKYPHATFFLNGGHEEPYPLEERLLIPSPQVATYDQEPAMGAKEITAELVKRIGDEAYGFIMVNFANPDMVGHTGNFEATVKAVETIDKSLGEIAEASRKAGAYLVITSDHGNAEQMVNFANGVPDKEHTTNPVPLIICPPASGDPGKLLASGRLTMDKDTAATGLLGDVAPTVLKLMGIPVSPGMEGYGLI